MTEAAAEPRIDRRSVLAAGALAVAASPFAGLLLGSSRSPAASAAAVDPAVGGRWSAPFGMGGVAIHATLTHVGDVLFFGELDHPVGVPGTTSVWTWSSRDRSIRAAPLRSGRDLFCTGHSVLPDGRVYAAGGHDHGHDTVGTAGVRQVDVYDPVRRSWAAARPMAQARWYPTTVALGNGRVLVFGGHATPSSPSRTVEVHDPATGAVRTLPPSATRDVGLYPRMRLMGDGSVLKTGPQRATLRFSPATQSWETVASMVFGNRWQGLSLLLHGGRRVLTLGGSATWGGPATATAEVLDAAAATPTWRSTSPMAFPRVHANGVLLPDGTVLVVGGGARDLYTGPVLTPELWNPATGAWTSMAPHRAGRMYHATTLLLPDGRVLVAGQDDGALQTYGEIWSPPYLFRGTRPVISSSPAAARYGTRLSVSTPDADRVRRVVLIRPGSITHQVDTDQRALPLPFTRGAGSLTVTAPTNRNLAPPGYWMLFLVDGRGVPSVARWVHLS